MVRWTRILALPALALILGVSLPATAQDTQFAPTEIFLQDADDGTRLSTAGVNSLVQIVTVITYSGNDSQSTQRITINMSVTDSAGQVANQATRSVTPNRTEGGTTEVVFDWRPASTGRYDVSVTVQEAQTTANRTVTVGATAAKAGTIADRLVDYWYVTALFGAGVVLFLVMVAARRRP